MGEMADMFNEYQEATLSEAYTYLTGGMSDYEAFEKGILDSQGGWDIPEWLINEAIDDTLTPERCAQTLKKLMSVEGVSLPYRKVVFKKPPLDDVGMDIHRGIIQRLRSGKVLSNKQRCWVDVCCNCSWDDLERHYKNSAIYSEYLISAYKNIAKLLFNGSSVTLKQKDLVQNTYYGGWEWFCVDVPHWCNK